MNAAKPSQAAIVASDRTGLGSSNFANAVKLFNAASPLLTEPQPSTGLRLSFAAAKIWRSTGHAASMLQH
jgi:hypothetical protein